MANAMDNTIMVRLLGKLISFRTLSSKLHAMWSPEGNMKITDAENGYYMVRFDSSEDCHKALLEGPWTILGHYLLVQPYTLDFDTKGVNVSSVATWIRFPGLPFHYYHKNILRSIASEVGTFIKIDYKTVGTQRGQFARMAVRLDLRKPLVWRMFIDGKLRTIEYESLPFVCYKCARYGHVSNVCPFAVMKPHQIALAESSSTMVTRDNADSIIVNMNDSLPQTASPDSNDAVGPWIHASRHMRRTKMKITDTGGIKADSRGPSFQNKSRFDVLADDNLENVSVIDSSKPKKFGEPNKELLKGNSVPDQRMKKATTAITKLPSQKVYKVKDIVEPTRPLAHPQPALIGKPKSTSGPKTTAEPTVKAHEAVCSSLPVHTSPHSSSSSVNASLPMNASLPSAPSSANASLPLNASLASSSPIENTSLPSTTVLSTSLLPSSPASASTSSRPILHLPSISQSSPQLISSSPPSSSPHGDTSIQQETKPLGDSSSEIVMEEAGQQFTPHTIEFVCPPLDPTKRCLDGEHHTVVVIDNKGLTERLGGGYSLPLPRTTNTLGRPPDPSKSINLKGDLKIKRQTAKVKRNLTPYMRDNVSVGNTSSNVDDSSCGVVSESSIGEPRL
ncbi:hypothetical protein Syun_028779 [Stephania yunnanensis]|uniref:CCHC-type domain-containing protein n=1 Tax=Stephania yunnanensis TaxID=152371 RepID=A0AAP0HKS7_9MAGN